MTNFTGEYMEYLILVSVVVFLFGFWLGGVVTRLTIKLRMAQIMLSITEADLQKTIDNPLSKEDAYLLNCEEHEGILRFYDAATNQFVCQGKTLDEASKNYLAAGNKRTAEFVHNETTLYFKYEQ